MTPAIRVHNLGKRYRISHEGDTHGKYRTLRDSLSDMAAAPFRRLRNRMMRPVNPHDSELRTQDSRLKTQDSGLRTQDFSPQSEDFWALKDVSFDVQPGEVVGIIGRNGAGKSTLLKILSRITKPTTGTVELNGRVGSLLEVGTGFHQELTGRENVYLNGSILGMKRAEIQKQFDAIVDFSGVEKFLDTPVKRYSSGMYVRLAFAVAAHLEPEILIIDEVLAVGDAEFQRKCLAKMDQVSRGGRTIIFVSHNMIAVNGLCHRAIWMDAGCIRMNSDCNQVISAYLQCDGRQMRTRVWEDSSNAPGNDQVRLRSARITPSRGLPHDPITINTPIRVEFEFWNRIQGARLNVSVVV
jgi:lipopolysaccharide transport system ATP-binding protein